MKQTIRSAVETLPAHETFLRGLRDEAQATPADATMR